jgi:PleD family two-component response regulator
MQRRMKVLLLQFKTDPACAQRREALAQTGATVTEAEPRWPVFFDALAERRPDVIVIAASTIPSHGIEAARYLGDGFNTRDIPVYLVDVAAKDQATARISAPRARLVGTAALPDALQHSSAR